MGCSRDRYSCLTTDLDVWQYLNSFLRSLAEEEDRSFQDSKLWYQIIGSIPGSLEEFIELNGNYEK